MPDTTRLDLGANTGSKDQDTTQEAEAAQRRIEELKSNRSRVFSGGESSTDAVPVVQVAETQVASTEFENINLNDQSAVTQILQQNSANKKDVSAVTVGRMLGLVTSAEFQLLQGKLDLLSTRISNAVTKLDKLTQSLNNLPTGSDLERIDVQLGGIKQMLQEALSGTSKKSEKGPGSDAISSTRIMSND